MATEISVKQPELTDLEAAYALQVGRGMKCQLAAKTVGYSDWEHEPTRLHRRPHVLAAIAAERSRIVDTYAGSLGLAVLMELAEDTDQPGPVRQSAARWLAEAAGLGAANKPAKALGDKTMGEMTAAELRETMRVARAEMDKTRQAHGAPVSAEIVDITPDKPNVD